MNILYNKFFKMAKVWGLDIPLEFSDGFNKFLKLNWQNQIQRVTIADSKPALARSSHIAGRSYIPDFIDDWQSLTEAQQTKWLKDWGDGAQQAFALFFQNNYYRQINALQVRTTPNFFTYPAGWLHIAAGDTAATLRFSILSGDYILSDPANILHMQSTQVCNFAAAYSISATIKAKLQNISDPESAQCQATITQFYTDNEGDKSRQSVIDALYIEDSDFSYIINTDFVQADPSEIITGFRIDFEFLDAMGDIWFYAGEVSVVDDVLGVVRLHNVINFQDVEKIYNSHLANIKNQWSLINADAGTTLRRVFPYAYGYPEETEKENILKNGTFDSWDNWWDGSGFEIENGFACLKNGAWEHEIGISQSTDAQAGLLYTLEFDLWVSELLEMGHCHIQIQDYEVETEIDFMNYKGLGWQHLKFNFQTIEELEFVSFKIRPGWTLRSDYINYPVLFDNMLLYITET